MTPVEVGHWERAQSIFAEAADLPEDRKRAFVEEQCGGDERLAASVFELLEEDTRQNALLDGDPSLPLGWMADLVLQPDSISALIQQQIGPYRLVRLLGEGGMGVVYLAERTDIGGLVAIKLLRDAWMSPMRRERFRQEQQTLVKLNHPAIARLYDASTTEDGTPWFVMEYAEGEPLTQYLTARSAGVRDDLLLFLKVCEAVRYAHSVAIIHRDLKPSNIVVTKDGEVKLLDFGIAKEMAPEAGEQQRTIAGLRLLTPGYAAPEQYSGEEIGVFTDVYSLGVLLYEILTGSIPDPAEAREGKPPERPSAVVRKGGGRRSFAELSRQQWSDLDVICLKALETEPDHRYRSVDALIRDVNAYLEGRVLEARPASLAYTVGKFARRNRAALIAVCAGALVLAGAGVYFTVRLARARDAAVAEAARTARIQHFMFDMLGNGDEEAGPASDLKVTSLLDREAQQAGSLSADARTQIDLYQTLGTMYDRLGKFDQSQRMLSLALDKARQTLGMDNPKIVEILVQLATLHGDQGDLKAAQQEVQQALDMAARAGLKPGDPIAVQARLALGRVYQQSGQAEKVIATLDPIAQADPKQGVYSPEDVRDAVSALATAQLSAQHYDLAEADGQRAVDLDRKLLGASHPQTGLDIVNLASVKATLGDLPGAEALYREGVASMKAWYGPDHPDVATASTFLAHILILQGKDAQAEQPFRDALRIQEKAYGPTHERVAFTLNGLGEIESRRGDLARAEADLRRAVAINESLFGESNYKTAATRSNLGAVYLKETKNELAEATLKQAVVALALLPAGNNLIGIARGRWGRALLALKRYSEAETQLTLADGLLKAQHNPAPGEVANVRSGLATLSSIMHRPPLGNGLPSRTR